ncbi:cytochrome P450 [Streptomyces sp. NPDC020681]|uniref:cytochrome P450 n=1 Tax=Streptomyces sp. NPDC020681 TaxID=3365083 RepID=UPI0037A5C0B1
MTIAHSDAEFDFNPTVSPHREDPHLFYRAARKRPVTMSPSMGAYMVSRYADIKTVLDDPDTFSSTAALPKIYDNPPEVVAELEAGNVPETTMVVNEDEPRHKQMRALFDAGVSGARVRMLLPLMKQRADELINGFTGGTADLVSEYAFPYVQTIINAVIGFPPEDSELIQGWTDDLTVLWNPFTPVEDRVASARRVGDYTRYLQEQIDDRRANPRDDMISGLVHGANGFPGLSDDYIHNIIRGAARVAGFDTTRDAITATVFVALRNPDVVTMIAKDPIRTITKVTEEALRHDAPNRALGRITTREVELGGTVLPQGSVLLLLFGAANRDETVFPDPDAVDLNRPNVHDHVAFGKGLHACPGAPLARAEIRVALQTLFASLPNLRLAEDYEPTYIASYFFRGLESLRVRW